MSVDSTTVRRIARLARIKVADDEIEHLEDELSAMLAFVEQLSEVDVTGIEPMTSVTPTTMRRRADQVTDGGIAEAVLAQRAGAAGRFLHGSQGGGVMCEECEEFPPQFVAYFNKAGGKFWRPAQKVAPNSWAIDIRPVAPVEVTTRPFVCDAPDETPQETPKTS